MQQGASPTIIVAQPVNSSRGVVTASWVLIAVVCLVAMLPVLGFASWLIAGPVLFITVVMGIIAMARGSTLAGLLILLVSLIGAPIFIAVAPFVSSLLGIGAGAIALSESSNTSSPTRRPTTPPVAPSVPFSRESTGGPAVGSNGVNDANVVESRFMGKWVGTDGYTFGFDIQLKTKGHSVSGEIRWTYAAVPQGSGMSARIGKGGTEFVSGTYDEQKRLYSVQGTQVTDATLLGKDEYRLVVSEDGSTIEGTSRGNGDWRNTFLGISASPPPETRQTEEQNHAPTDASSPQASAKDVAAQKLKDLLYFNDVDGGFTKVDAQSEQFRQAVIDRYGTLQSIELAHFVSLDTWRFFLDFAKVVQTEGGERIKGIRVSADVEVPGSAGSYNVSRIKLFDATLGDLTLP